MPRIAFDTFAVEAPREWADITDTVVADDPPFTLARRAGVGALQFSIALYESGPVPNPTPVVLRGMVREFGHERGLGKPSAVAVEKGPPRLAAGSFRCGEDFLRVWQVSDGGNFAFVTFTCEGEHDPKELAACERIVRSITFRSSKPQR